MKTPEERLWDWLEACNPSDSWKMKYSHMVYNYVTRYWEPKRKPRKPKK